jgi:hypothetical protein
LCLYSSGRVKDESSEVILVEENISDKPEGFPIYEIESGEVSRGKQRGFRFQLKKIVNRRT